MGDEHPVEGGGEHAEPHDGEEDALQQRRARPPHRPPADGDEPEQRDGAVAEKIERIGLQPLRAGEEAAAGLDQAVADIEDGDDPQRPLVGGRGMGQVAKVVIVVHMSLNT